MRDPLLLLDEVGLLPELQLFVVHTAAALACASLEAPRASCYVSMQQPCSGSWGLGCHAHVGQLEPSNVGCPAVCRLTRWAGMHAATQPLLCWRWAGVVGRGKLVRTVLPASLHFERSTQLFCARLECSRLHPPPHARAPTPNAAALSSDPSLPAVLPPPPLCCPQVLDPEQNAAFVDTYLGLPFDLSSALFVATANRAADIPPPLLDRLEVVQLGGYTLEEKVSRVNVLVTK